VRISFGDAVKTVSIICPVKSSNAVKSIYNQIIQAVDCPTELIFKVDQNDIASYHTIRGLHQVPLMDIIVVVGPARSSLNEDWIDCVQVVTGDILIGCDTSFQFLMEGV
jgi:hypothetical protein